MNSIRRGQRVTFLCASFLEDGTCLEAESDKPIKMIAGQKSDNKFSAEISRSLLGMRRREKKHLKVPASLAFGEWREDRIFDLQLSPGHDYYEGKEIQLKVNSGDREELLEGTVIALNENSVSVDTNHPLAGKTLVLKIEVIAFN